MQILIQKYGGTSVQNKENRKHVIRHIQDALAQNYKVVVVVSALGRKPAPYATDSLLSLVDYPRHHNSSREIDLLMSCGEILSSIVLSNELQKRAVRTTVLTGGQAGIITNADFNKAKVIEVRPSRILKEFEASDVIIVAGFQGQTKTGEVTTIGRGGSDTTAAALGASLKVKQIEVFTDVSGIMTADPRIVKSAKHLDIVTYTEICNLAYQGAKVIHPRAVEIAMQSEIPIKIRSTYSKSQGTLVTTSNFQHIKGAIPERLITGIAHSDRITQIKVAMNEEAHHLQSAVFKAMADANISVDFINVSPSGVIYTVSEEVTVKAVSILRSLGFKPDIIEHCAKVSAVGAGMSGVPGIASKIVQALTDQEVQILQSGDSHTTIWILVHEKDLEIAVNALHDAFELSKNKMLV